MTPHFVPPPAVRRWPAGLRRWSLWSLLVALVAALLATLVWLAARHEASQLQERLERDTTDALADIRAALTRNVQALQGLGPVAPGAAPQAWKEAAEALLREHPEWLRIERRDGALALLAHADSPARPPPFARLGRESAAADVALACSMARRASGAGYSSSYFLPQQDGLGVEVLELCLPMAAGGRPAGYLVASYALPELLARLVGPQLGRNQEVSFVEPDGTRLALHGKARRNGSALTSQQLLDLPGNTLVLRIDSWRETPDLFPNVLTALVTAMSIALVAVLALLAKDTRRRLAAEHDLAEALAFRKAMEDSLVTGLRARDLQGRITYVNPAFCQMVGFTPEELNGHGNPAPYWPTELAGQYEERQEIRLAGNAPPREGFESVFMRKDGSRFPVLIIEAPLINALGRQTGWMSAFVDLTEQRRGEELSRASQERLQATARLATVGEMASMLSHELNQPLAAISSYAAGSINLMERGAQGAHASDFATAFRRIAEQAERAGRVIKSVHDFVRRRDQARETVTPRALIEAIMPLVNLQARKLQVGIAMRCPHELPPISCDRTMVEQALLNLARNGMQAMDQPGAVDRSLRLEARALRPDAADARSCIEFIVADFGPGIAGDVAQQLFTPFFTTKPEGMGLGLSLCRTVAEQHAGSLAFEANVPQGTIFRLVLPAAPVLVAVAA